MLENVTTQAQLLAIIDTVFKSPAVPAVDGQTLGAFLKKIVALAGGIGGSIVQTAPIAVNGLSNKTIAWNADTVAAYGNEPTNYAYYLSYLDTATQLWTGRFVPSQINKAVTPFIVFLDWDEIYAEAKIILITS